MRCEIKRMKTQLRLYFEKAGAFWCSWCELNDTLHRCYGCVHPWEDFSLFKLCLYGVMRMGVFGRTPKR